MIFKNGINLYKGILDYLSCSSSIYIIIPYIKLDTLKLLIDNSKNIKAIFVRWELNDLITNSSDLDIFPYLKSKGISLYRNPRIHLKVYLDNYHRCFITSANISSRALNAPDFKEYNHEIGTIVDSLTIEDRYFFLQLESDSVLVNDTIYLQICDQISLFSRLKYDKIDFDIQLDNKDIDFLITALPLTYSVEDLLKIYQNHEFVSETDINCALHDLVKYNIQLGLHHTEFYSRLKNSFFSHPFILAFLKFVDEKGEIYFGSAKDWIHKKCVDVPTPRKWEITENIQILFRWIVELSDGKYQVDRPNYSERLRKMFD
jgi:hypothetical protein